MTDDKRTDPLDVAFRLYCVAAVAILCALVWKMATWGGG